MPGRHVKFRGLKFDYVIVDEVVHMVRPGGKADILIERDYTSAELGWVPPTPITRGEAELLKLNSKPDDWVWK